MASTEQMMDNRDRTRQLEYKYIELLEKRIASLEALINKSKTETSEDAESTEYSQAEKVTNRDHPDGHDENPKSDTEPCPTTRLRQRVLIDDGVPEEKDIDWSEFESQDQRPPSKKEAGARKTSYKLTWYKVLSEKRKYKYSEFNVDSPELQALLRVTLSHYPRLHFPSDGVQDSLTFKSPFMPLIHNWDKLEALTDEESAAYNDLSARVKQLASPLTDIEPNLLASACVLNKEGTLVKARVQLCEMLSRIRSTPELRPYFSGLNAPSRGKSVQFDFLWTLFPPGEIVYSTVFMREPQLFMVKQCYEDFEPSDSGRDEKRVWRLICWSYDWNGRTFSRVPVRFSFDEFQGSRAIETLDAHPLRFRGDSSKLSTEQLKAQLHSRGKRFVDLCIREKGKQMFDYEGEALARGTGFQKSGSRRNQDYRDREGLLAHEILFGLRRSALPQPAAKRQKIDGRVMVDFAAYLQHAPPALSLGPMGDAAMSSEDNDECRCSTCSVNKALQENQKTYWDDVTPGGKFEDLQFQLCPPRVLGYHLGSKTWMELNVVLDEEKRKGKYLKDIEQLTSAEAFDKLQLVSSQKELVQDLVQSHASGTMNKPLMEDIMKGKGKGLVILLHGPPGVGKTLTAESVAQLTGKPLFSVGVSDVGLKPEDVEQNLEALFELAANWRAVLLFDEADVFLESRSSHTSDLNRNALVSVLLRVLEYYDGILILTTNRIREFDVAVQSRVNLGIRYEDLDRDMKIGIIENFLKQLNEENVEGRDAILEWFNKDEEGREQIKSLNGRQVRNILFSAASLAMKNENGKILKLQHVKKMTKATYLFHDSIKTIVDEARRRAEARRS